MSTRLAMIAVVALVAAAALAPAALADDGVVKLVVDKTSSEQTVLELAKELTAGGTVAVVSTLGNANVLDRLALERQNELFGAQSAAAGELSLEWLKNSGLDGSAPPAGLSPADLMSIDRARESAGLSKWFPNLGDLAAFLQPQHPDDSKLGQLAQGASNPGGAKTTGGSQSGDATPSSGTGRESLADRAPEHPDRVASSSGGSSSSSAQTSKPDDQEKWKIGNTDGEGKITKNEDGKGYTVEQTHTDNDTGTTTATTSVYDADGNLVSQTVTTTDKDGNATTTSCTTDCPTELTSPDQETGATIDPSALSRPTLHQQRERPSNVDGATGTDGSPYEAPGGGVVDPSPEGDATGVLQSPTVYLDNRPHGEFGPDGPQNVDTTGQGPYVPDNGPISTDTFRP